jgi:phage terminase small subunit
MTFKKLTTKDILGTDLTISEMNFCIEYAKDCDARRAARWSGYASSQGEDLLKQPNVIMVLSRMMERRLDDADIDAAWVLQELKDNHFIARDAKAHNASNAALNLIMKHASVNAFAEEKVHLITNTEIAEQLARARKRTKPNPHEPVLTDGLFDNVLG